MNTISNKNYRIEYLRAFCIIAVVFIHTFYSAVLLFGKGASDVSLSIYSCVKNLLWWAVPCFLMISGSLLLNKNKVITLKKLYKKYILRMVVVLFSFGYVYAWLELFFESKKIVPAYFLQALLNVFTGNLWAHMWYIYCLIGIYVLLPVYKMIANHATDKEFKYILVILLLFNSVFNISQLLGVTIGFYCHISTIYPFWFLAGEAFNRKIIDLSRKKAFALFVSSSGLLIVFTLIENHFKTQFSVFFGYDSILVVMQAIAVFQLVTKMSSERAPSNENLTFTNLCSGGGKLTKIAKAIMLSLADKSFGIYLVHMVFVNAVYKLLKFNPFGSSLSFLCGILLGTAILIGSCIVSGILKKFPILKKYI